MSRKRLALMVSEKMDTNKKEDRNENVLIRMSAAAREYMGFEGEKVELWPENASGEDRINKSIILSVYKAFSEDLKRLKEEIASGKISEEKALTVGFVTNRTFSRICGGNKQTGNIWISEGIYDTVIGADPEFLLENEEGKILEAKHVFPKEGEIGSDGGMAEIRPKPEVSVENLVRNMLDIFKRNKNHEKIGKHNWIATCYHDNGDRQFPVGGHIHIGNPKQLMSGPQASRGKFYKVLNKALDEYLSVPLVALDGKEGSKRRDPNAGPYTGYGYYGELRTDLGRLEHRTLSGIWLLHPSLSRAVLGTAKAVIDEAFRRVEAEKFKSTYIIPTKFSRTNVYDHTFDSWDEIPLAKDLGCVKSSKEMKETLLASDPRYVTKARITKLYERLRSFSTYEQYAHYIDGFIEILNISPSDIDKFGRVIQKNWLTKKKFIVDI